jgi:bleomycin hydrolase
MKNSLGIFFTSIILLLALEPTSAQDTPKENASGYQFTIEKEIPCTPVKDQFRSGTCWSFSGLGFLEAELIRMGKGQYDLSEMFVVRQTYLEKGKRYVRFHGNLGFGGGGAFHDVTYVLKKFGMVPEDAYPGLSYGEDNHVHGELDEVTKDFLDGIIKNPNKKLSTAWMKAYNGILDAYLGAYPEKFQYKGKEYSPRSFANELGLNPDDYLNISSYTHHPFYKKFIIEIPDNWAHGEVYNLPLDELIQVIDHSIDNGYSVAWASDVSEKGFSYKNGLAIVPEKNLKDLSNAEILKWQNLSQKEKDADLFTFDKPGVEKKITQEMRQEAFDNFETTDDHGMVISGTARDINGTKYYLVKNSWAATSNKMNGFFYASLPFVQYKTMSIMVHRNAIPKDIQKKLGL